MNFKVCYRILMLIMLAHVVPVISVWGKHYSHVHHIAVPEQEFFGSIIINIDTSERWQIDLHDGYIIHVEPFNTKADGEYWQPATSYILLKHDINEDKAIVISKDIIQSDCYISSIRIEQTHDGVVMYGAGGKKLFADISTHIKRIPTRSGITVNMNCSDKHLTVVNRLETYPKTGHIEITDSLFECLRDSKDKMIGIWTYLDRITPKSQRTVIGGRYIIAVLEASSWVKHKNDVEFSTGNDNQSTRTDMIKDSYLLVYVDGADECEFLWMPGDIKGRLIPTAFEGIYDLEWYDSHKRRAGMEECSATIDGVNLMTLDFPLLESQIRLQRFIRQ